ncbi:hypothetical protein ACQW5G_03135 [Fructilactobacillus sp. Tb1]|uniref:hypothetical protein n=1 Tax=Fructilactobacillus sp. Tb1 TaxID=3422304 RepID=UPI003D298C7F
MTKKAIIYDGIKFPSHKELANHLGISSDKLYHHLKSDHYNNNNLLEFKSSYTGKKYNHLTAVKEVEKGKHPKWLFQCDCGKKVVKFIDSVTTGKTKSCGHARSASMHNSMMRQKQKNYPKYEQQMENLRNASQKSLHKNLNRRNKSGIVGVTHLKIQNQYGNIYDYWQASLNVKKHSFVKRFRNRDDAIRQRAIWELEYCDNVQPAILKIANQ